MNAAQVDTSVKQKEKPGEDLINVDHKLENERELSCSSSSTSSDDSSEGEFFQLDATELSKTLAESSELPGADHLCDNAQLASELMFQKWQVTGRFDDIGKNGSIIKDPKPLTEWPFSLDVSGDTSLLGARNSPPLQVMGRFEVPDPNRIPASIFARSATAPMEWSVASNESLFSINVGNSSFSRDHVILLGRSGDLTNFYGSPLDEPIPAAPRLVDSSLVLATATEEANAADVRADKDPHPAEGVFYPTRLSHQSDGSTTSIGSFAFPIFRLTGEGRSGSIKVEPEPQSQQKQPPFRTETPKPAAYATPTKWFSCFSGFRPFSCCRRRCCC